MSVSAFAYDDIIVITHVDNQHINVTGSDIRNLYLGTNATIGMTTVALSANNKAHAIFNTKVIGFTESRLQAYWLQMQYSEQSYTPPLSLDLPEQVLRYIEKHKDSIGYLPSDFPITDTVRIIYSSN